MPTVTNSTDLRKEIQAALSSTEIILSSGSPFSVRTLAKISSLAAPLTAVPATGYIITGVGQQLSNTRIYQQNVDGKYAPGTVQGAAGNLLTLNYTSGGAADRSPLLSSRNGSFTLDYLNFTGVHQGWIGNGGVYMHIATSNNGNPVTNPITVDLTLSNSVISITGQTGFNPAVTNGGGSAFLHSFDNTGTVTLFKNQFNEAGFLSSFNFYNQSSANVFDRGTYQIVDNTFSQGAGNTVVRRRGSRLTNVMAYLSGNTFKDGSYLDVFGNIGGIQLDLTSKFTTIAGGYGIKGNYDVVQGNLAGNIEVTNTAKIYFDGAGLPLKYVNPNDNQVLMLNTAMGGGEIYVTNSLITNFKFYQAASGGQGNDVISPMTNMMGKTNTHTWAYGDDGNDLLNGATEEDYLDGGNGNDTLIGNSGQDTLLGGLGDDSLLAGAGNDWVDAGIGNDSIFGAGGNDTILTGSGSDLIYGGDDADSIVSGDGDDTIFAELGDDTVFAGIGSDYISLNSGTDVADGGLGNDTILCGDGDDSALGGDGDDSIFGELNNDTINGNDGNDTLSGGFGTDIVTGGNGIDRFVWNTGDGTDFITDFDIATEQVVIPDIFASTPAGSILNAADFITVANLAALNGAASGKVYLVQAPANGLTIQNTSINLLNSFVLIFNNAVASNKGTLWYDNDWNSTGSLSRTNTDIFSNVSSNATLLTFTNANFFAV